MDDDGLTYERFVTDRAPTLLRYGYVQTGNAERDPRLWRALAALPRRQRAVLVLCYYEDLPDDEIAAMLGISRGTVRSQAARALDKLRADWSPSPALEGAHHDR